MPVSSDHFRKLEHMYHSAPINTIFESTLRVSRGEAEVTLVVRADFFHAAASAHGAVYFKALDDATYFAASSLIKEVMLLTVSFNLYLLRPLLAGTVRAAGRVVQHSHRTLLAEAELTDARGRPAARGSGMFMPGQTALSADIGYRL